MPFNDIMLLEKKIERDWQETASDMSPSDHQIFFVAQHYLKAFHPTLDDLVSGLVDGERDGGLDAMYIFVNSHCIRDDAPVPKLGRGAQLDLFMLQVKNSGGFGAASIDKLLVTLPKILEIERDERTVARSINSRLMEISRRFLEAYANLDAPQLRIFVTFASLKADHLHDNIVERGRELEVCLQRLFSRCTPEIHFLKAEEIYELADTPAPTARNLILAENPVSTDKEGGWVAFVGLPQYRDFITDQTGQLDVSLFEANVRDYEGATSVNNSIQQTLLSPDDVVDFWWLNNGVTIVATEVRASGKMLKLESPQIVNGLQTSMEVYRRPLDLDDGDTRSLLVKVIEAPDSAVRERIIRATNSQTSLQPSALRATDRVQRHIEDYLKQRGLYYERRRNYYFNQRIAHDRLVSIDVMGQAVLSVLAQKPHIARANPSRVFDDDLYEYVFNDKFDVRAYSSCLNLLRATDDYLTTIRPTDTVEDLKFHVAMLMAMAKARREEPSVRDLVDLEESRFDADLARKMVEIVQRVFHQVGSNRGNSTMEPLAKDDAVTAKVFDAGRAYLHASRRPAAGRG